MDRPARPRRGSASWRGRTPASRPAGRPTAPRRGRCSSEIKGEAPARRAGEADDPAAQSPAARPRARRARRPRGGRRAAPASGVEAERGGGQPVGEPGVLGQQRAVQVGADARCRAAAAHALEAASGRRCRGPCRTRPSGCAPGPRRVRPPWFSKPASTRGAVRPSSTSIATLPISRGPSSRTVSRSTRPTPGQPLVAELVAVAEQLVAAADAEDHGAAVGRGVQRVALDGREVLARRAPGRGPGRRRGRRGRARPGRRASPSAGAGELEADPAPGAAALEQQQVAAVGVDVHQVGIERADAQGALSHARTTTSEPTCSSVSGIAQRRARRAGRAARLLGLERARRRRWSRRDRRRRSLVRSPSGATTSRRRSIAHARPSSRSATGRLARRSAADLAAGRAAASRPLVGHASSASAMASASDAARARGARARRGEEAGAAARRRSSWIVCIGTVISAKRGSPRSKPRASATTVVDVDARRGRALAQRGEQLARRGRARSTSWPGAREVERDAAGARADVEHRAAPASRGQLPPQRQVGAVARRTRRRARRTASAASSPVRPPRRAAAARAARAAPAARCRWAGRRAGRRRRGERRVEARLEVGLDHVQPPGRRPRTSSAAPARRRACRSRSSGARAARSTSQSASHTQETSRPSAMRSLSTPRRSSSPPSSASVRSTSLAPAGFLTSRIEGRRPARSSVSARPKAGATASQAGDDVVERRRRARGTARRRRARCRRCRGRGAGARRGARRPACAA